MRWCLDFTSPSGVRNNDTLRAFSAWLGVVPSESSSGERRHRGGVTKTGNKHLRRLLVGRRALRQRLAARQAPGEGAAGRPGREEARAQGRPQARRQAQGARRRGQEARRREHGGRPRAGVLVLGRRAHGRVGGVAPARGCQQLGTRNTRPRSRPLGPVPFSSRRERRHARRKTQMTRAQP